MANKKSINDIMEAARLVIWNAHQDETIRSRFEPFGFDEKRHQDNKALYQEVSDLIVKNKTEHDEWELASEAFNTAQETARMKLDKIRRYLKFWYDADSPEAITLSLYNNKISKYADFMANGSNFYAVLLVSDEVLARLQPFGYTTDSITADAGDLNALNTLRARREQESGDAQFSIKERNAKLDELDECVSEMVRLARLIFRDGEAQYLEKLGVVVRS